MEQDLAAEARRTCDAGERGLMLRRAVGGPAKKYRDPKPESKKPDPVKQLEKAEAVAESVQSKLCECGNPVHGQTHQCWSCAHRA